MRSRNAFTLTENSTKAAPSRHRFRLAVGTLILGALALPIFTACPLPFGGSTKTAVSSVSVSPTSVTLSVGETQQLTAAVSPEKATNKAVAWSSSDSAVASVNTSGLVTAVSPGSATITVTTADGGMTATCAVTVKASGAYDLSFNGTGINGIIDYVDQYNPGFFLQVIPLADGKTLAVGHVQVLYGVTEGGLMVRFNGDGSLDTTFGSEGTVLYSPTGYNGFYGAAVDGSGNIYVAGRADQKFAVWKYSSSGNLDTSFSASDGDGISGIFIPHADELPGIADKIPKGMARGIGIDGNGKILVGGYANSTYNDYWAMAFRLNADGSRDTSYGSGGAVVETRPYNGTDPSLFTHIEAATVDSNGRMLMTGYWTDQMNGNLPHRTAVWRFTADGEADTDFGTDGVATLPDNTYQWTYAIAADPSGGCYVGGSYRITPSESYSDAFVAKLDSSGVLVSSFGTSGYATFGNIGGASSDVDDQANALLLDGAGGLYLAGSARVPSKQDPEWGDEEGFFVMRISASSGVRDTNFGTNGAVADYGLLGGFEEEDSGTVYYRGKDDAKALALDSIGRLLVGGGSMPAIMDGGVNISQSNTPMAPFVARFE